MSPIWRGIVMALWVGVATPHAVLLAGAQDSLERVKSLYASAAYEDALTLLADLRGGRRPEIEQYRVFCLVALGRTDEAEKAIAWVVTGSPAFIPSEAETPPRIQEMFVRVRRALVPDLAQRLYLEARAAFDRKEKREAEAKFAALVELIDSTTYDAMIGEAEPPMLAELRLLAAGFLDLSRSVVGSVRETPPPTSPAPPSVVAAPVTLPVARRQRMPPWVPADTMGRQASFIGAVRVMISADGTVTGAEIERSVHPAYDPLLLQAAKSWEYAPATRGGVAIPSEQVVQVQLKPRQ